MEHLALNIGSCSEYFYPRGKRLNVNVTTKLFAAAKNGILIIHPWPVILLTELEKSRN
jgi:hypothetical protein